MAQQVVNTEAVVKDYDERKGTKETRRLLGELVVGVRVDDLPAGDAERLAAAGKFHPLTTDKDGNLRVAFPAGAKVEITELEVLLRIEALLIENRDLLRQIA